MEHYAGIDVSLKESSVCVVDATGKIVREVKVASEPEALVGYFDDLDLPVSRIGLEAGPLSQWLHAALVAAGREVVLLETRHVKAAPSAMTVKTDRKDARGIAQLLRMGWYRAVHAKSANSKDTRALLVGRKLLQGKLLDVELSIRGILRGYGLKVGDVSRGRFEAHPRTDVGPRRLGDGDRRDAGGARGAMERVHQASSRDAEDRARRRGLPPLDVPPGRRRPGRADLSLGGG